MRMLVRLMKSISRMGRSPFFWVTTAVIFIAIIANLDSHSQLSGNRLWAGDRPSLTEMNQKSLQREGTPMTEIKGRFLASKDRTTFIEEESKRSYKCLENLMLQRVEAAVTADGKIAWVVTGKLTEYENDNYLLVEKAVRTR